MRILIPAVIRVAFRSRRFFIIIFVLVWFVRLGRVGGGADDRGILNGCFKTFEGNSETGSWDGKGAEDEDDLYGWESPIIRTTEGATRGSEETNYVLD